MSDNYQSLIDPDVVIEEKLPTNIQTLIEMAKKYDREHNDILYFDRADDIWVNAKNAYVAGVISKETWEKLEQKYLIYAIYAIHVPVLEDEEI